MLSPSMLSDSELATRAPSIFTDHAAPTTSARYGFVSTASVVGALRGEGFAPVYAGATKSRKATGEAYSRHLIRFRHNDIAPALGEGHPEIVLRNDHAGGGCFEIRAGFFRLVCSNGLILQSADFGSVKVRHNGTAVANVVSAVYSVAHRVPEISARIDAMRAKEITFEAGLDLAKRALALRYGAESEENPYPVNPEALLLARRPDDVGSSLWQAFNSVQENIIRGTRPSPWFRVPRSATGRARTMRQVRAVNAQVDLNAGLWQLAESYL